MSLEAEITKNGRVMQPVGGIAPQKAFEQQMGSLHPSSTLAASSPAGQLGVGHNATVHRSASPTRFTFVSSRFKTRLCPTWETEGSCPYNAHCMFAHSEAELRTKELNLLEGITTKEAIKQHHRRSLEDKVKQQTNTTGRAGVAEAAPGGDKYFTGVKYAIAAKPVSKFEDADELVERLLSSTQHAFLQASQPKKSHTRHNKDREWTTGTNGFKAEQWASPVHPPRHPDTVPDYQQPGQSAAGPPPSPALVPHWLQQQQQAKQSGVVAPHAHFLPATPPSTFSGGAASLQQHPQQVVYANAPMAGQPQQYAPPVQPQPQQQQQHGGFMAAPVLPHFSTAVFVSGSSTQNGGRQPQQYAPPLQQQGGLVAPSAQVFAATSFVNSASSSHSGGTQPSADLNAAAGLITLPLPRATVPFLQQQQQQQVVYANAPMVGQQQQQQGGLTAFPALPVFSATRTTSSFVNSASSSYSGGIQPQQYAPTIEQQGGLGVPQTDAYRAASFVSSDSSTQSGGRQPQPQQYAQPATPQQLYVPPPPQECTPPVTPQQHQQMVILVHQQPQLQQPQMRGQQFVGPCDGYYPQPQQQVIHMTAPVAAGGQSEWNESKLL